MTQYQWGYVDKGICAYCNTNQELWTHSASKVDYNDYAICVWCHITIIKSHMWSNNLSEDAVERYSDLLKTTPLGHPEIYGEREPFCGACGHIFNEESERVKALDYYGDEHEVHAMCTVSCDHCENLYLGARYSYTYSKTRNSVSAVVRAVGMLEDLEGENICMPCVENNSLLDCEHCSRVGDSDNFTSYRSSYYCNSCYEDNVAWCGDCDENYWADDGHDCPEGVIKAWDYKPDPDFYHAKGEQSPTYYLGLELEVENTRDEVSTETMAEIIQDNYLKGRAYIKHDGSISEGFEIVTHPHTLEAIRSEFNWDMLEELRNNGFRSWNASDSSCGIHVHVSRTAFGQNDRRRVADHRRDAHMLRFMKLIYDNQRQVERLAGRSSARWADFSDRGRLAEKVKNGSQRNGRYSAVNTDNYATLEVRVFKGSLKRERVLSALEFVTASVEYTRNLKVTSSNKALSWAKFVSYVVANEDMYPNLLSKISESLASETITD